MRNASVGDGTLMPNNLEINSVHQLAQLLKGTLNYPWFNFAGPGHSADDRSCGVKVGPKGFIINSLAGDDLNECEKCFLANVANAGAVIGNLQFAPKLINYSNKYKNADYAVKLWESAKCAPNTLVMAYLLSRNCISLGDPISSALRFAPGSRFRQFVAPAMLGRITDLQTNAFKGIHRTAIKADGSGKICFPDGTPSKMMLGTVKNGAVKLSPLAPIMGIAEGIETALSAALIFKMPVWATLSAGGMVSFPIIPSIENLTIFADDDDAGQRAANQCARRYAEFGIGGQIRTPSNPYGDWNDFIQKEQ